MADRRLTRLIPRRQSRPTPSEPSTVVGAAVEHHSTVVDSAVYVEGDRIASPGTLADTYRLLDTSPGGMAWIGLYRPPATELSSLAEEFDLHELSVEDAIVAHQRPKLERYGATLFVVLHAARYLDSTEEVEFGELHIFAGENFVITVRHSEAPDLAAVRRRLESRPELLRLGPEAVLYAIMDRVVDGYFPVADGIQNDIDEIEIEVFRGESTVSRRIYELSREVIEFQRAIHPLQQILAGLDAGFEKYHTDEELQRYLRDVADHVAVVGERVDGFREALRDMLTVNATLVAQQQNEEMKNLSLTSNSQNEEVKRISSWAAILFAPTLVASIYGMNFKDMPELHWKLGYPFAILLMVVLGFTLYQIFKRRGWL